MYQSLDTFKLQEVRSLQLSTAFTPKRNFSQNKRSYNSLTKQVISNNYILRERITSK